MTLPSNRHLLWLIYIPFVVLLEHPEKAAEWLARLHLGLTPPAVLTWLAFSGDAQEFEHTLFADFTGFAVSGLSVSAAAAWLLWMMSVARFRFITARTDIMTPELAVHAGMKESEIEAMIRTATTRKRSRGQLILATSAILVIGGLVGSYLHVAGAVDRDLRQAVAELDAKDLRWRIADIEADRVLVPPEKNAANRILAAAKLLPPSWPSRVIPSSQRSLLDMETINKLPPPQLCTPDQTQLLRFDLASLAPAIAEALRVSELPQGRYAIVYAPDYVSTLLPHVDQSRKLLTLMQLHAIRCAHDARSPFSNPAIPTSHDGANVGVDMNISRALGDEPFLVSMLVRIAQQTQALSCMERVLALGEVSGAELQRMQQALADELRQPILLNGYRGERALYHAIMEKAATGELKLSTFIPRSVALDYVGAAACKRSHAWGLRNLDQLVDITAMPAEEQVRLLADLEQQTQEAPWLARTIWSSTGAAKAGHRSQANLRSAMVALAVERYRLRHQRWPEQLADLTPQFLDEIPVDPFDGKPLHYRRLDDGVVVYSIGVDQQDNGGKMTRPASGADGIDLGFQLWDVAQRRQKPANSP